MLWVLFTLASIASAQEVPPPPPSYDEPLPALPVEAGSQPSAWPTSEERPTRHDAPVADFEVRGDEVAVGSLLAGLGWILSGVIGGAILADTDGSCREPVGAPHFLPGFGSVIGAVILFECSVTDDLTEVWIGLADIALFVVQMAGLATLLDGAHHPIHRIPSSGAIMVERAPAEPVPGLDLFAARF